MSRRKIYPLKPWETALKESTRENGYNRMSQTLYKHPAFKALTTSERFIYLVMVNVAAGKEVFSFPRATYVAYGLSHVSVIRAIKKLVQAGFLVIRENNKALRKPNIYQFSYSWKENDTAKKPS